VQGDPGQPCWQYPHGTSLHVGQPFGLLGAAVGVVATTGVSSTADSPIIDSVDVVGRQTVGNSP